jgi:hypothetical protein
VLISQSQLKSYPSITPYRSSGKKTVSSELYQDHSSLVRVQMVDLAGSEKDPSSKDGDNTYGVCNNISRFEVYGTSDKDRKELKSIRKSLTTLGYIIKSLAKGASAKTMPYRDTVLTYLLKDALNGRNHTTMLATISPATQCYDESLSTLRYAEHLCLLRRQSLQPSISTKPYVASLVAGDHNMKVNLFEL